MNNIIPFGKYKGQPIEAIIHDKEYIDWLMAQSWFRNKFGGIYTLIINNFQEPTDTPEHNKLQMKFLDEGFCISFIENLLGLNWEYGGVGFEANGYDVMIGLMREPIGEIETKRYSRKDSFTGETYTELIYAQLGIEIKPTVSDDFPSILRVMKRLPHRIEDEEGCPERVHKVLCLHEYTGIGASKEQFVNLFNNEGIKISWI